MNRSAGLTLIEVLVAIFILALIAGSFLTSYGFAHKHNTKAETVLMASFIAQTKDGGTAVHGCSFCLQTGQRSYGTGRFRVLYTDLVSALSFG